MSLHGEIFAPPEERPALKSLSGVDDNGFKIVEKESTTVCYINGALDFGRFTLL